MNIILILILIYLLFKYKSIKKEDLSVYPSDLSVLMYDKVPEKINNAELLFLPRKTKTNKYITHNPNIYVKKSLRSFYDKNYGYNTNQLYYNDFRWKYIDVYVTKELSNTSLNWIKLNSVASPGFFKMVYIHDDHINRYNRSLKQYVKMNVNLIVCNINPYKCYKMNDMSYIVTNRNLNGDLVKSINTTNAYLKLHIDHHKLVCVLYEDNKVLHTFTIESLIGLIMKNVNLTDEAVPGKTAPPEERVIGIPKDSDFFSKWKDPRFENWFKYFKKILKMKVDPSVDVDKLEIPTNHLNYLYIMVMNHKKQININHIVEQIITDMQLPTITNNSDNE